MRVIPRLAQRAEGPHSRAVHHANNAVAMLEANATELPFPGLGSCKPLARSLAVCATRDDTGRSAHCNYAATRRFCFTIEEVERLPEARAPLRFGLSD